MFKVGDKVTITLAEGWQPPLLFGVIIKIVDTMASKSTNSFPYLVKFGETGSHGGYWYNELELKLHLNGVERMIECLK